MSDLSYTEQGPEEGSPDCEVALESEDGGV